MAITAQQVKELRKRTGAPMLECKKALEKTEGDMNAAIEEMRKAGQAKATKKAGRIAANGGIYVAVSEDGKRAAMVEVNSETDFVARDENFMAFAEQVVQQALATDVSNLEELTRSAYQSGHDETIEQARQDLIVKIGENIQVRRVSVMSSQGVIGFYVHGGSIGVIRGGRIGVLVDLLSEDASLAKGLAMHIAASSPLVIAERDVSEELIAKEREIYTVRAEQSGKPAQIVERIVEGQLADYLKAVSLLGQPYVKDTSMTVTQLLQGANAEVSSFVRFEVGEGIEEEVSDFAEEVKGLL